MPRGFNWNEFGIMPLSPRDLGRDSFVHEKGLLEFVSLSATANLFCLLEGVKEDHIR